MRRLKLSGRDTLSVLTGEIQKSADGEDSVSIAIRSAW
jgi:hypothetical protein